jgi:cbb3-type cytochrome oxidase maturation protein
MTTLLILIPASLGIGLLALIAFMWALRSGQFDDLDGAANRILFDDDDVARKEPEKGDQPGKPSKPKQGGNG